MRAPSCASARAACTYAVAAEHLKLYELASDPAVEADVTRKLRQAEALVVIHLKIHLWDPVPEWDENTDPATDQNFALAQAGILMVLENLWRFRGGDDTNVAPGPLTPRVVELLNSIRDPSFA